MLDTQYYLRHAACPECGGRDVETTTSGCLGDKDGNAARCTCGWVGIVDDLEPMTHERK